MIVWHVETSSGARFEWAQDEDHMRRQMIDYYNETCKDEGDEDLPDDAEFEEAREAIEEHENLSYEEVHGGYLLDAREVATIRAALRNYQDRETPVGGIFDISTAGGKFEPMTDAEIDGLFERIKA